MKNFILMLILVMGAVLNVSAQKEPYKIVSMEDVTRWGNNCEYDTETCTAKYKGPYARWFDIPGMTGDFSEHSKIRLDILESTVMLKFVIRYRGEDGKTQEVTAATLYRQMGSTITKKKTIKLDLAGNDGEYKEMLKNCVGIRVSMAKAVDGAEESEWMTKFGTQFIIE